MDITKISPERLEVLARIQEYEKAGRFDEDVENDPEAPELLPENVDYLCEKFSSKVKRRVANFLGDHYFLNLIKKDILVIDGVTGEEHLAALQNGAMITCNHFSPFDNYIVFHCIRNICQKNISTKLFARGIIPPSPGCTVFCFGIVTRCRFRATAVR